MRSLKINTIFKLTVNFQQWMTWTINLTCILQSIKWLYFIFLLKYLQLMLCLVLEKACCLNVYRRSWSFPPYPFILLSTSFNLGAMCCLSLSALEWRHIPNVLVCLKAFHGLVYLLWLSFPTLFSTLWISLRLFNTTCLPKLRAFAHIMFLM